MKLRQDSKNVPATTDSATRVLHIAFLPSRSSVPCHMLYASAAAARRMDKPAIDAQPLHIRWVQKDYSGPTTFTFFVFFLTTPLHELLDKLREKAGRLPDVLAFARHQIDMVEHRDTLLHQLPGSWCKDCHVHAVVKDAVGGPASPASSAPGSPSKSGYGWARIQLGSAIKFLWSCRRVCSTLLKLAQQSDDAAVVSF